MKTLEGKKIKYKFPYKSGIVDEELLITKSEMKNGILFFTVSFLNKKKYVELTDKFHKFNIYNTVEQFLKFCSIKEFQLTIEEIHD